MELTFVRKDPDKAYIGESLWLPKSKIRAESIKTALEFTVSGMMGTHKHVMWGETSSHIVCPREFLRAKDYPAYGFPFVDLRPKFQRVDFTCHVKPRNHDQERAIEALLANDSGILNLGCGKGKTKLSLLKIAQKKVPTLVVVPNGGILSQWEEAILGNKAKGIEPSLEFDGELGLIKGPVFNWATPITLALVSTLWMRIEDGTVPTQMFRHYGLIIFDEVHQIGAPKFSLTARPFLGDRIGLTATVQREDGLDPIYLYHIGDPFYSDLVQDLIPRIYFQQTPITLDYEKARVGEAINISLLRTMLGRDYSGNVYRYYTVKEAVDAGRKVLCLSHSVDQLRLLHSLFPGAGLIIGDTPQEDRMQILRDSQICFAIASLGTTGVDDASLDTLFLLTPFRSKNALQQAMGRIQRALEGKRQPVMVAFDDWTVPSLRKLCMALKSILRKWGYEFETLSPSKFPTELPKELEAIYQEVFSTLPNKGELVDEE